MTGRGAVTAEQAIENREKLTEDGFCVVGQVLSHDFLDELRRETDRLLDTTTSRQELLTPRARAANSGLQYQGSDLHLRREDGELIDRLINWQPAIDALLAMGLDDFESHGSFILLSKPPGGPRLYWHHDWMDWNDPISLAPWPQKIFLSYYLHDTLGNNGCFQIIPGSHRKRIDLHDELERAQQDSDEATNIHFLEHDERSVEFREHPNQVDVPVKAGDLVIGEARALHAARANSSDTRRSLLLGWFERPRDTVPGYWQHAVPKEILKRNNDVAFRTKRNPGRYLVGPKDWRR